MYTEKSGNRIYGAYSKKENENYDIQQFELLFTKYAPKAFGFISNNTDSIQESQEYLIKVFLIIWENVREFEYPQDKKFVKILLMVCRPLLQKNINKVII